MEATRGIAGLLLFLYIVFGKAEVSKELAVRKGKNVTFSCEGRTTGKICHVSWTIKNTGSRKVLTRCANTYDKDCNVTKKENVCSTDSLCAGTSQCIQQTNIENNLFTSKLEIPKFSSDLRQSTIECIMIDSLFQKSEEIVIMQSYTISIYYESINCDAKRDNNIINISCKVAKVFPNIKFRIVPERSASDPEVFTQLPELSNLKSDSYRLAGTTEYFDAYCNEKYYPTQNGTFRFRVGISAIGNSTQPAFTFPPTNSVTIGSKSTSFERGSGKEPENITIRKESKSGSSKIGNESEAENFKTGTEIRTETSIDKLNTFNLFIGSVLALAVTSFIIMSWAICTKKLPCQSTPSVVDKGNEYESIRSAAVNDNNEMHVNSWQTGFSSWSDTDTLFSFSTVAEESQPTQSSAMLTYTNPRPHTNRRDRTYIDPITPTSTLNGFAQGDSSFDPTNHGENCSTTYVKTVD